MEVKAAEYERKRKKYKRKKGEGEKDDRKNGYDVCEKRRRSKER